MARMTPTDGTSQDRENAAWRAVLAAAQRGALAHGLTLLAELGRRDGEDAAFLARQDASRSLVGVHLSPRADKRGYDFAMVFELDVSLPGPAATCPRCARTVDGWTRTCECGADISGVVSAATPDGRKAQLERVRDATRADYEILGSLAYSGGGGVVYFARHLVRGDIVPLRVYEKKPGGPITVAAGDALPPIGDMSPLSGAVSFGAPPTSDAGDAPAALKTPRVMGPGSILLRRHSKPVPEEIVAVPKVCPRCGIEYDTSSRYCPKDGSPLRPKDSADPLVGQVIADRYHVLKHLGEGGMGRVYLAEHVKMHRQCAIKVMNAALVNEPASAARFEREASSAARILHPNVAAVFDYGETDDIVYLVMEFVDGESLSAILKREDHLTPQRALDLARQVADGLAAAHELGIVHRDLKPDNILIAHGPGGREVAKVVDFGIAKVLVEHPQEGLTRTGFVIGTPEFMSPEQLLGDPVDARSDIYSLGCILYIMLTGKPAFSASTREQMIKRRLSESPPHPNVLMPELHPSLDAVVVRMMERAPAARFNSAADVRDALLHAAASRVPTPTVPYRPTPRSVPTVAMDEITDENTSPGRRRKVRRRALLGAGIIVVGVALFAFLANGRTARLRAADSTRTAATADSLAEIATAARAESASLVKPPPAEPAPARPPAVAASSGPGSKPVKESPEITRLHRPIDQYRAAFESGDIARVRAAYPAMPVPEQTNWGQFFAQAAAIHANVTYTGNQVANDSAAVDFTMRLRFTYTRGRAPGTNVLKYHARLARESGAWVLKELKVN